MADGTGNTSTVTPADCIQYDTAARSSQESQERKESGGFADVTDVLRVPRAQRSDPPNDPKWIHSWETKTQNAQLVSPAESCPNTPPGSDDKLNLLGPTFLLLVELRAMTRHNAPSSGFL